MDNINDMMPTRECTICGKQFIYTQSWVYKIKQGANKSIKYQCSYTCWRKAGGGKNIKRKYARREKIM